MIWSTLNSSLTEARVPLLLLVPRSDEWHPHPGARLSSPKWCRCLGLGRITGADSAGTASGVLPETRSTPRRRWRSGPFTDSLLTIGPIPGLRSPSRPP
jgi:hypothetical protein